MKTIGALVFPEFELLDMYGPLEMFGLLRDDVEIRMVAESQDPVRSSPGPGTAVDDLTSDRDDYDILIPHFPDDLVIWRPSARILV